MIWATFSLFSAVLVEEVLAAAVVVVVSVGVAACSNDVAGVFSDSWDSLLHFGLMGVPAGKGSYSKVNFTQSHNAK